MIKNSDVLKAIKRYNIGKVEKIKQIKGGIINYNFDVKTNKGNFIVRFLGYEVNKYEEKQIKLEFSILNYLYKNKFTYLIPSPIKNKDKKYLTTSGKNKLWIYKKIPGETISKPNKEQYKEIIKTVASYNSFISKKKWTTKPSSNYKWLIRKYEEMRKIKQNTKLDKLILENIDFFEVTANKILKKPFNKNIIPIHSDMHCGNFIFKGDTLVGILDFGNVKLSPRIREVAHIVRDFCFDKFKLNRKKMNSLIKEYSKINPLTTEEKGKIIRFIIKYNCILFWWTYSEMKQEKHKQYSSLKFIIESTKELVKTKGWKND